MTKRAYVFLANGFEEVEAIGTWDVLMRSGVQAIFVSIYDQYEVEGAHGFRLNTCMTLNDLKGMMADAIVLPGGMPGATNLYECAELREIIQAHHQEGKLLGAICAAPLVYGRMGLLEGKNATCYPGFEPELKGATAMGAPVCVDGQMVTAKGPAYVFDFGLALAEQLVGEGTADEVSAGLLFSEQ